MPLSIPSTPQTSTAGTSSEGRREAAARWVTEHGDALWRFAVARVAAEAGLGVKGRAQVAEELVQETLLAAMGGGHAFAGRSTERTWLMGIMAHKIADHFRRCRKEAAASRDSASDHSPGSEFTARGAWARLRRAWPDPSSSRQEQEEQTAALLACIEALPPSQGEAVWLREVLGIPTRELCKDLGVSETNLWTRLHRARLALRACLDGKLGTKPDSKPARAKETP